MSLLKRTKDKQLAAEKKLAARHAIVKLGVDRNVRDADFLGLVFAAVANDDEVDAQERTRLEALGEALELPSKDVADAIESLLAVDDDAKMAFIAECACQLSRVEVAECFLKEFEEIWKLGGGKQDEVAEFRTQLIDWMGKEVKSAIEAKANAAAEARRKAEEEKAAKQKQAEEEQRREADKVSGFLETVAGIVEEMRIVNESRVNNVILKSFRSRLTAKGLETVDTVKAYKAIYDAFVSKTEKAMRENASGQESLSACALKVVGGLALGVPVTGALSAVVKGVCPSELDQLPYQVSWAVIALCILKKDVDSADLSQFNGLLQDAHSHGMKRVAFRSVTYDPNYFWKTYLHERVAKILGLGSINEGDVVVEAPKKSIGWGGGEGDRRKRIFENASVKRLFSEWQRLCGAYCQYIPELTYRVQDAGCRCVQGIALPRNYLKDVALKFLSGSVSPSFQGRGETEWVKDRGAVLGILLLHYIGSSDFNPSGEEVEDLRQIYQLAQRQSIQDRLVAHIHKYLEIE